MAWGPWWGLRPSAHELSVDVQLDYQQLPEDETLGRV